MQFLWVEKAMGVILTNLLLRRICFFFYLSVFPVEVACALHFTKKGDWAFINRLFELLIVQLFPW